MKKSLMIFRAIAILAVLMAISSTMASVQITKLDSPFPVNALYQFEDPDVSDPLAIDFDHDGQIDLRVWYAYSEMDVFIASPTRVVIFRAATPGTNIFGQLGALPLGTTIGSNIISSVDTNIYIWHTGDTNPYPDLQSYGDHRTVAVSVLDSGIIGQPLVVGGDLADKEGVIGVEFLIGTNKHYGYIHFDFRKENGWYGGSGGNILGWAYETEPGKPIVAAPIAASPAPFRLDVEKQDVGIFNLNWRATPGATYRIQGTPSMTQPFVDFTGDIVPPSGLDASPLIELVTFEGMQDFPEYYWRVERTK